MQRAPHSPIISRISQQKSEKRDVSRLGPRQADPLSPANRFNPFNRLNPLPFESRRPCCRIRKGSQHAADYKKIQAEGTENWFFAKQP